MTPQKMYSRTNPVHALETSSAMTSAQIDQELRDFVLQDTAHLRRDAKTASQGASRREPGNPSQIGSELVQRVAGASLSGLDEATVNFCQLRDFLHVEGERIKQEIFGYLQLNQVVMDSTKLMVANIAQYRGAIAATAPRLGKGRAESERSDTAAAPSPAPPS